MSHSQAMERLGYNSGNLLFINALQQYLTNDDVDLDVEVISSDDDLVKIPENYDACIINCSNWIGVHDREVLKVLGEGFRNFKTPVYFIGLGAQAPAYGRFEFLDVIRNEAKAMIGAVLDTGGGFGLRGAFTAEVFQRLGFRDYTVVGCPSLYQKGRDLMISNEKVAGSGFKPLVNGPAYSRDRAFSKNFRKYSNSEFICQGQFHKILHCASELTDAEKRNLLNFPDEMLELLKSGRVRLYRDIQTWFREIKADGFNFSFGTRIHGNFASILCGIPAFIHTTDSRTAELADFFSVPHGKTVGQVDLYELYMQTDYSEFNRNFPRRYDEFCGFLRKHNLPLKPGRNEAYEAKVSQTSKAPPPRGIDEGLKRILGDYLHYAPPKHLLAVRPDKRFWYLADRRLKPFLPFAGRKNIRNQERVKKRRIA
jgi:hypothetical protein